MRHFKIFLFLTGFLLLTLASPISSKAQDMEKTVIITKKWGGSVHSRIVMYALSVTESYNSDLTIDNYRFLFSAQNDKYELIQDLFVVAGGSAQEVFNFTKWVLSFIDTCQVENLKVPIEDFNVPVTIEYRNFGIMGKKYYIQNGSKYHCFKKSDFEKIQKELLKYCKEHGIDVDTKVDVEVNPSLAKKQ
ncbi:MAG: hypothetical protein K2N05_07605 [Muribaculaceae bacterium]|nr:hypothetical protein [Muribaculaceae bacterium]